MTNNNVEIAVLLTCFNRKNKTIQALRSLFDAGKKYNECSNNQKIDLTVFLTDDGCSDGTADAVKAELFAEKINILTADGNAYWAGGMRIAWRAAIDSKKAWDFYLLVNDDTQFKHNFIEELLITHDYSIKKCGKAGVYTGFISSLADESVITYGAMVYHNSVFSKAYPLHPNGQPQICSMTNANILMVSNEVVEKIGILDDVFIHGAADFDYGIRASKAGFPVLTTANVCGYCENDHDDAEAEKNKVLQMTLKQRKAFLDRPNIKQYHDSLLFYWRYDKIKWAIFGLSYYLNLYCPKIYYSIFKKRGH